ncbi:MAG TPA: alpha/beta hydrolase [Allosphingosinicella sp.]|jgi:pimeloyl-ACP methyl ester carboxylesterase
MLVRKFLMVGLAVLPLSFAEAKPYVAEGEQTTLAMDEHRYHYRYKTRLVDGRSIRVFCKEYTFKQLLIWDGLSGSVGFHVSCRKSFSKNRKIVIWIHGGPWHSASRNLTLEQLAFMSAGYDLFIPHYPGSTERRVSFDGPVMVPDVVTAFTELKGAFGWSRKRYERVDVFGESFGTFLAASLAPELGEKNSLFLHNPSLGGKRRLEEYYAGLPDNELMNGVPTERARGEVKRITDAYFGRLKNYEPIRILQSTKGLKLKLVYGGRDNLMVPGEIESLARLAVPGCGVDYRRDNEHESAKTVEQYESFRNLIRCGNARPSNRPDPAAAH